MLQRIIYLDQWAWIRLARAHYGKDSDPGLRRTFDFVRTARQAGWARFPLSLAHFLETAKHRNAERRRRLAVFMLELSALETIASLQCVVAYEIDAALRVDFGNRVSLTPLQLLGKGVGHAAGHVDGLRLDDPAGLLPPDDRSKIETAANAIVQFGALAGSDTFGFPSTRDWHAHDAVDDRFVDILRELPEDVARVPRAEIIRDAYLCGRCLGDLRSAIDARLAFHGISRAEFEAIGPVRLMNFVHRMPSRRIELHLMLHTSKDPNLKRERSDLNDWAYLGLASAYCDVVVAEKQFGDIVNRGTLDKKAVVISSLDQLPTV